MAIKKELSLKERRKIFEETIGMIQSIHKMNDVNISNECCNRKIKNLSSKQLSRCHSILAATLHCEESVVSDGENKKIVMVSKTTNLNIEKDKFDDIANCLPGNRETKEVVWKALVKGDKKAIEKLSQII